MDLAGDFGVDLAGLEEWRKIALPTRADGARHGRSEIGWEQYDRQHRLTALNEQIGALECALARQVGDRGRLDALLSAARSKRAALVEEYRAAGARH